MTNFSSEYGSLIIYNCPKGIQSINPADVSPILEVILTYGIQVKWHLENVIYIVAIILII